MSERPPNEHHCWIVRATSPDDQHVIRILAMPSGFRYSHRYDEHLIHPELRGKLNEMIGHDVLLLMQDSDRGRLVPLRWARAAVTEQIGGVVYVECTLTDLVAYSRDSTERSHEIESYARRVRDRDFELSRCGATERVSCAVFPSAAGYGFPRAPADDLGAWGNLAAAAASAPVYEKADFLKIVGFRDSRQRPLAHLTGDAYRVFPNAVYTLLVFQTVPNFGDAITTPRDLIVRAFPDQIRILRGSQRVAGKYDMLAFDLKVLDLPAHDRTSVEVAPKHAPSGRDAGGSGSISIPLIVQARRRDAVVLLIRLLLAALALAMLIRPQLLPADAETVRSLATAAFVLAVASGGWTRRGLWPWVS